MTWHTQGRQSATLPNGANFPRKVHCLNAFAVACYGWRSPSRALVARAGEASSRWITPLCRWTRPMRRAA